MAVIVTRGLTKRYGRRLGIDALSLEVPSGALFGFLGPNGSGKTTTIRLLLALLRPSSGRATIFGQDCWQDSHRIKADLGYVAGDLRLYSWMTARIALSIFGEVRHLDLMAPGLALARQFELEPDVRVRRMSRGMRQKLGLILALVHRPKLLILDEPTASLDPLMQQILHKHLRERAAEGATVFFSSHTLSEVEDLCDRVAILRDGVVVADEDLDAMRARAQRQVTLHWRDAPSSKTSVPPRFLDVKERSGHQWQCTLTGPVMDLVRWGATQPLEDLTIGRPDLESLFQEYYQPNSDDR